MLKNNWLIFDGQYGSTGKGLLAGYLAYVRRPDTVVCAWGPNAGHTFIDIKGRKYVHRMIPNGIVSPNLKCVLIGPGAVIDVDQMWAEVEAAKDHLENVIFAIHEHAAVCTPSDAQWEKEAEFDKIGSTLKGTMKAQFNRMMRPPDAHCIARNALRGTPLESYVVDRFEYLDLLDRAEVIQVEAAQGFGLSMYHGIYPYVTSKDVTPHQIYADCGIPISLSAAFMNYMTLRTYPIRVNNRTGTSGPGYPDQYEIKWSDIGQPPELTTVTQLPRRLFTFSWMQLKHAILQCGPGGIFLNFCNYLREDEVRGLVAEIEERHAIPVMWTGWGDRESDVVAREEDFNE